MRFDVLTAVSMLMVVIWFVMLRGLLGTNFLEKHTASIFSPTCPHGVTNPEDHQSSSSSTVSYLFQLVSSLFSYCENCSQRDDISFMPMDLFLMVLFDWCYVVWRAGVAQAV
jgi:hypothetical protein